ncbi:Kinesin-like protein KIF11 [Aphelenchoides besseyi]|nr:Kinesin-like protein KIF11 [Aphelenchoides besseyi]
MSAMKPRKRNVQTVVRVRPLNGNELIERARNIVSIDPKNKQVHLREKATMRPFGPFDRVYDENHSQGQIYKEVVEPLILQVLQGFNCTVFAYGQTGSGKTYTMEGHHDEDEHYTWENDPKAGVIPRALHHIFTKLESERPEDYSVRASYVELYNEQIFDLLSGNDNSLRVFDNKDKGIIISGMEDTPVRSRAEVYGLLRRGTERRKTASTLMNISSSRSHSVFTLTVTTRQTIDDEELLRVGKIHLVDLAGSENVGRSGAVEARAREAGNINTSLLALGRVITALTTNAAHVPYRESKLTRILQDSLGGKTITTIIATLSPASTNFEESMNTLEYVQRAKNIKNNPEANQCLSRKNILLAYDEEILRLQRDLAAARFGTGIYPFSKITAENEESRTRIEELEHSLLEKLNELSNLKEDLQFMDKSYMEAYEQLRERLTRYERRLLQIEQLQKEVRETERNYTSALDTLEIYDDITKRLREKEKKHKETAVILFDELALMHSKVDALRSVMENNDRLLGNFSAKRISAISESKRTIEEFESETMNMIKVFEEKITKLTSTMHHKLEEEQTAIEHRRVINESKMLECSPLPNSARELLQQKQADQTPLRMSLFRVRDSIRGQELPKSPNTIRQVLPSKILTNDTVTEDQ